MILRPRAEFLSLAEELQSYILSFLSCKDILRCSSVCKALRQTYLSCSELQYITELGGQQLLPVPDMDIDNKTSFLTRLQLLRDKAHAWFKLDIHSSETVFVPEPFRKYTNTFLVHGHLCLFNEVRQMAKVFPILPKPSQQIGIEHDWFPESLHSIPDADCFEVIMDPEENLIAIAYVIHRWAEDDNDKIYIDLGVLDGDGAHPQAAGRTLSLSSTVFQGDILASDELEVAICGRHLTFLHSQRSTVYDRPNEENKMWWLQIWDWKHSTTSNCVISDPEARESSDFCFLGNDRLLTVSKDLKLYSIEDLSQAPQLLACFLMPVSVTLIECLLAMDDNIAHSSPLQRQVHRTMWTSDPKNRLVSLVACIRSEAPNSFTFVISTRIFFNLQVGVFGGMATIPWECWGPLNSRIFPHDSQCRVGISGNRVLHTFPATGATAGDEDPSHDTNYKLYMIDFSPLAVQRRQGLGTVVTEPSTIELTESVGKLTTFLPYVAVVFDRTFGADQLMDILVDEDRIYLCKPNIEDPDSDSIGQLEVIDI
ncbi:hypothetical protein EV702DRAFT_1092775 [Suillus placidus]|uniref:F-box domain-containing protein n=1 Tax=Suillus placidus TaxID=48579 RepID=A0A9P7D476_9AGAM|nr:hypothetical protein EV702DRAFT_1092775 [Suillus placidus]